MPSLDHEAIVDLFRGHPGSVFHPLVLGPASFPRIVDMEMARKHPDLTVLSALIRAGDRAAGVDLEALAAAWVGADALDDERSIRYADMLMRAAGPAARQILEVLMSTSHGYEFKSEFALKYLSKGREEGREEGREVGKEEGRLSGIAEAVVKVMASRGLPVSDAERETILGCTDLDRLDHWLTRALTVSSVEELLRAGSSDE